MDKKKDKSKKLNFAEVYNKCNHNKYSEITEIKGKAELKSNLQNFFKNYGLIVFIICIICMAIFIYTFRNNPISILYCVRNYYSIIYIITI